MKFSENLKRIRKENNLSQEQLAEKVGVSRQAVSKWESGAAYPEMDKVLLICKIFNYNIDELLNENVKEVDETKQSKINLNKYIEDFFGFVTKTAQLFSSMKFWQIVKCLLEQCIIASVLVTIVLILDGILSSILYGLVGTIFHTYYGTIHNIVESIYLIFALIVGITIILHIFKIRYLDYYEIVNENKESEEKQEESIETNNTVQKKLMNKREKVIIRDANHSGSKFLEGCAKLIVFGIKFFVAWIALGFCCSFVMFATLLVVCFMFIKAGLVFCGSFLGVIAALVINFAILEVLYNFIVSKKNNKTRIAIMIVVGLLIGGMSIGMILIGATKFNYIEDYADEDTYNVPMTENLCIDYWNDGIEYEETDSNDVKIVVKHSEYTQIKMNNENEMIYIYSYQDDSKIMEQLRKTIEDINNKQIKGYSNPKVYVYASKENIEKMKYNRQNKIQIEKEENDRWIETQNTIDELQNQLEEKDIIIEQQKDELSQKEDEITILQENSHSEIE